MDASKIDATELAAVIALGGVLISASVAYLTASRSVYVNAVTTARIKWIENVRKLVVELRELSLRCSFNLSQSTIVTDDDSIRLIQLAEEIRLTLGRGRNERNVIILAEFAANPTSDFNKTRQDNELLAGHAQRLLEEEWRRVKREASPRLLQIKGYDSQKRDIEYVSYCRNAGNFPGCISGPL